MTDTAQSGDENDELVNKQNVTDVIELEPPEEVVLNALIEEFGPQVNADLNSVAKQAIENRIHELRANRDNVTLR
jgi:hypothetical protein